MVEPAGMSLPDISRMEAFKKIFSPPLRSGWKLATNSMRGETRPRMCTRPPGGHDAGDELEVVPTTGNPRAENQADDRPGLQPTGWPLEGTQSGTRSRMVEKRESREAPVSGAGLGPAGAVRPYVGVGDVILDIQAAAAKRSRRVGTAP